MYDLIIRSGTVVDGTGSLRRPADVAIENGQIAEVGRVAGLARRTIDADGLLVTPGFVDIHTHYDGQVTWDPHLTPSCWHGVTTVITGNCGVGFAPTDPLRHQELLDLMEGVEDIPGTALSEGIKWNWETFPQYLDALDQVPKALDVGTQIPHAPVRAYVMGDRCRDDATQAEVRAMCGIVAEALRAGALGFTSGRTRGHKDIHGGSVPGTTAALDEITALFSVVAEAGHGVCQLVPSGVGGAVTFDPPGALEAELAWLLPYAERSGQPITFLAMEQHDNPDQWQRWVLEAVRSANRNGANVRPQVASRCFGILIGHQSRMNPFQYRPSYRAIADVPLSERVRLLRDPDTRARILAEVSVGPMRDSPLNDAPRFDRIFPLTRGEGEARLNYEPRSDESIAALAQRTGANPWEVLYDRMLEQEGREFLMFPVLNYGNDSYDGLYNLLSDPLTVQGLGDGGAHAAVVCDASMTTYLITHWARDRTRGPRLPLEDVVRRLTSDGATLYGLHDRGVIAPGRRADINLIDFDALTLCNPERVNDLPAQAGRLIQRANGYVATMVAGEIVVDNGRLTEARPGRLIRGSAPT